MSASGVGEGNESCRRCPMFKHEQLCHNIFVHPSIIYPDIKVTKKQPNIFQELGMMGGEGVGLTL